MISYVKTSNLMLLSVVCNSINARVTLSMITDVLDDASDFIILFETA